MKLESASEMGQTALDPWLLRLHHDLNGSFEVEHLEYAVKF